MRWPSSASQRRGSAEAREIIGRGDRRLGQRGDAARDQVALLRLARPQRAIDAFADEVDEAVALAQEKLDVRVLREEARQARHDDAPGLAPLRLDAQQPARTPAAEGAFDLFDVVEDRQAAPIIGLAVERRAHMPRRAQQQARAEPRLEPLDDVARGRGGQAKVLGGADEAAALDDPGEQPHGVEPVHYSLSPDSDRGLSPIIWRAKRVILGGSEAIGPRKETLP